MSRSSATQVTPGSQSEEKSQATTAVRKKNRRRRLSAAVAAFLIGSGVALWTVIRVETPTDGDAQAQPKAGRSQERPATSEGTLTTIIEGSQARAGEGDPNFVLGTASPGGEELDIAIADARKATLVRPDDADAQAKLGAILIVQGKLDEAIAALREATRLKPGRSDTHCKLGRALSAQGKLDEAVAEFRETIRLEPGNVDAHQFLGESLARQGRIDEATERYLEADRLRYDPSVALTGLTARDEGASNLPNSRAANPRPPWKCDHTSLAPEYRKR